eukprot:g283.t1
MSDLSTICRNAAAPVNVNDAEKELRRQSIEALKSGGKDSDDTTASSSITFVPSPSFEEIKDALCRVVSHEAKLCNGFPGEHFVRDRSRVSTSSARHENCDGVRVDNDATTTTASTTSHATLVERSDLSFEPLGGFHDFDSLKAIALISEEVHGKTLSYAMTTIRKIVSESSLTPIETVLRDLNRWCFVFGRKERDRVDVFCRRDPKPPLSEYKFMIDHYLALERQIAQEFEDLEYFPLVQIDTTESKRCVAVRCRELAVVLLRDIEALIESEALHMISEFERIAKHLAGIPTTSQELVELHEYSQNEFWDRLGAIKGRFNDKEKGLRRAAAILSGAAHFMSPTVEATFLTCFRWIHRLEKECYGSCAMQVRNVRRRMERKYKITSKRAQSQLTKMVAAIESVPQLSGLNPKRVRDNNAHVCSLRRGIAEQLVVAEQLRDDATLLNFPPTDFVARLKELHHRLKPYTSLWKNCVEHVRQKDIWSSSPVATCDSSTLTTRMSSLAESMEELLPALCDVGLQLAQAVISHTRLFLENSIELFALLSDPKLRNRHRVRIARETACQDFSDASTFVEVADSLKPHVELIGRTCAVAASEYTVELHLRFVKDRCKQLRAVFVRSEKEASDVVWPQKQIREARDVLLDTTTSLHVKLQSRFSVPFDQEITAWIESCNVALANISLWTRIECLRTRLCTCLRSLHKSHSSDNPLVAKLARMVGDARKSIEQFVAKSANGCRAMEVLTNESSRSELTRALRYLDAGTATATNIFESMRARCPWLYFVGNDKLCQLISASSPAAYLSCVTEGIKSVVYVDGEDEEKYDNIRRQIAGVEAFGGEILLFDTAVTFSSSRVTWINDVFEKIERSLCQSVERLWGKGINLNNPIRVEDVKRTTWQAIQLSLRTQWTHALEKGLKLQNPRNYIEHVFVKAVDRQIKAAMRSVKTANKTLIRSIASSLLLDAFQWRQLCDRLLALPTNTSAHLVDAFEWQTYIRHYSSAYAEKESGRLGEGDYVKESTSDKDQVIPSRDSRRARRGQKKNARRTRATSNSTLMAKLKEILDCANNSDDDNDGKCDGNGDALKQSVLSSDALSGTSNAPEMTMTTSKRSAFRVVLRCLDRRLGVNFSWTPSYSTGALVDGFSGYGKSSAISEERSRVVHLQDPEGNEDSWTPILESWLRKRYVLRCISSERDKNTSDTSQHATHSIFGLARCIVPPIIDEIFEAYGPQSTRARCFVLHVLKLLEGVLSRIDNSTADSAFVSKDGLWNETRHRKHLALVESAFLFCVAQIGSIYFQTSIKNVSSTLSEDCVSVRISTIVFESLRAAKWETSTPLPPAATFHRHFFDVECGQWKPFDSLVSKRLNIHFDQTFSDIVVPTPRVARVEYVARALVESANPLILIGSAGCGKSLLGRSFFFTRRRRLLSAEDLCVACDTPSLVDAEAFKSFVLDRVYARDSGSVGAAADSKCVVFVDDLHLVETSEDAVDRKGSVSSLLRQMIDEKCWRVGATNSALHLSGMTAAAVAPLRVYRQASRNPDSEGRRGTLSMRSLRHFVPVMVSQSSDADLRMICYALSTVALYKMSTESSLSMIFPTACALMDTYKSLRSIFVSIAGPVAWDPMRQLKFVASGLALAREDASNLLRHWEDRVSLSVETIELTYLFDASKEAFLRDRASSVVAAKAVSKPRRRSVSKRRKSSVARPKSKRRNSAITRGSEHAQEIVNLCRLWAHESETVMCGALRLDSNKEQLRATISRACGRYFGLDIGDVLRGLAECKSYTYQKVSSLSLLRRLHFTVVEKETEGESSMDSSPGSRYAMRDDIDELRSEMTNRCAEVYGRAPALSSLRLPMVPQTIRNILSLCRALRVCHQCGIAVFGRPGSGKRTTALLAAFMCKFEALLLNASANDDSWTQTLRRAYRRAGVENVRTVLVVSCADILSRTRVGHLSALIRNGNLGGSVPMEKRRGFSSQMKRLVERRAPTSFFGPRECDDLFASHVRSNLRVILLSNSAEVSSHFVALARLCLLTHVDSSDRATLADVALTELDVVDEDFFGHFQVSRRSSSVSGRISKRGAKERASSRRGAKEETADASKKATAKLKATLVGAAIGIYHDAQSLRPIGVDRASSYAHVSLCSYVESLRWFTQTMSTCCKKYKRFVNDRNEAIKALDHVKHALKSLTNCLRKHRKVLAETCNARVEQNEEKTSLESKLEEQILVAAPFEESFVTLLPEVERLRERKIAQETHENAVEKMCAVELERISTKSVADVISKFEEEDPPDQVLWVIESVAVMLKEQNYFDPKMSWPACRKLLSSASFVERCAAAAPDFEEWHKALLKRIWSFEEIESQSVAVGALARWYRARTQLYDSRREFVPVLAELESGEEELKARSDALDVHRDQIKATQKALEQATNKYLDIVRQEEEETKIRNRMQSLRDKYEHVVRVVDARVDYWKAQIYRAEKDHKRKIGEWLLGATSRAYLMRIHPDLRVDPLLRWRMILSTAKVPLAECCGDAVNVTFLSTQDKVRAALLPLVEATTHEPALAFTRYVWESSGMPKGLHALWNCLTLTHREPLRQLCRDNVMLLEAGRSIGNWLPWTTSIRGGHIRDTVRGSPPNGSISEVRTNDASVVQKLHEGAQLSASSSGGSCTNATASVEPRTVHLTRVGPSVDCARTARNRDVDSIIWPNSKVLAAILRKSDRATNPLAYDLKGSAARWLDAPSLTTESGDDDSRLFLSVEYPLPAHVEFDGLSVVHFGTSREEICAITTALIENARSGASTANGNTQRSFSPCGVEASRQHVLREICLEKVMNLLKQVQASSVSSTMDYSTLATYFEELCNIDAALSKMGTGTSDFYATKEKVLAGGGVAYALSEIAASLHEMLGAFSRLSPLYRIPEGSFVEIIKSAISSSSKSLEERSDKINVAFHARRVGMKIVRGIFATLRNVLTESDSLLLGFLLFRALFYDGKEFKNVSLESADSILLSAEGVADASTQLAALKTVYMSSTSSSSSPSTGFADICHRLQHRLAYPEAEIFQTMLQEYASGKETSRFKKDSEDFLRGLSVWDRLILLRCLRKDRMIYAMRTITRRLFIRSVEPIGTTTTTMNNNDDGSKSGQDDLLPPLVAPGRLKSALDSTSLARPALVCYDKSRLIDPVDELRSIAHSQGETVVHISMSNGSASVTSAEHAIAEGRRKGHWIVLSECEDAVGWLTMRLTSLLDSFTATNSSLNFRIVLVTSQVDGIPVTLVSRSASVRCGCCASGLSSAMESNWAQGPLVQSSIFDAYGSRGSQCVQSNWRKSLWAASTLRAVSECRKTFLKSCNSPVLDPSIYSADTLEASLVNLYCFFDSKREVDLWPVRKKKQNARLTSGAKTHPSDDPFLRHFVLRPIISCTSQTMKAQRRLRDFFFPCSVANFDNDKLPPNEETSRVDDESMRWIRTLSAPPATSDLDTCRLVAVRRSTDDVSASLVGLPKVCEIVRGVGEWKSLSLSLRGLIGSSELLAAKSQAGEETEDAVIVAVPRNIACAVSNLSSISALEILLSMEISRFRSSLNDARTASALARRSSNGDAIDFRELRRYLPYLWTSAAVLEAAKFFDKIASEGPEVVAKCEVPLGVFRFARNLLCWASGSLDERAGFVPTFRAVAVEDGISSRPTSLVVRGLTFHGAQWCSATKSIRFCGSDTFYGRAPPLRLEPWRRGDASSLDSATFDCPMYHLRGDDATLPKYELIAYVSVPLSSSVTDLSCSERAVCLCTAHPRVVALGECSRVRIVENNARVAGCVSGSDAGIKS